MVINMDLNTIAGICSILSFLISLVTLGKVYKISTNINIGDNSIKKTTIKGTKIKNSDGAKIAGGDINDK